MAKTSAERTKEMRRRRKQEEREKAKALAPTIFRKPFSDFLSENGRGGFADHHLIMGEGWYDFSDDEGLKPFDGHGLDDEELAAASNSLGKADRIISVMQDVVFTLAQDINDYKRAELNARIAEIEQLDLSDPAAKKKAFADMARLQKIRDQLDKQVRWGIPQWEVSGE